MSSCIAAGWCNLLAGGICMSAAGHCVYQIDACARNECFPPWSAGKPDARMIQNMFVVLSAIKACAY